MFFKKLVDGGRNFFKKLGNDASNVYQKVKSNVNDFNNNIINKGIGLAKSIGTNLEKYTPDVATGLSGIAGALGQGELIPSIMGASNAISTFGRKLKNTGNDLSNRHAMIQNNLGNIVDTAGKVKFV